MMLRAVELLEDGEWHDYDRVLAELAKMVPPGRALRRNEMDRRHASRTTERKRTEFTEERRIASGKRAIAKDMLNKEYIEVYPPGKVKNKRIRMTQVPSRVLRERLREGGGDAA